MSTMHDDRNPAEVEREVEDARARLQNTLGEIRERMSPGQMLDQALDYARHSGGAETARNFGRQVRDNPLPLALVGAGIAWMMTGDRFAQRSPYGYGMHHDDIADRMSEHHDAGGRHAMSDGLHRARAGVGHASDSLRTRAGEASEGLRSRAGAASASASDGLHRAGETLSGYAASARDRAGHAREAMSDYAASAGDGLDRLQRRSMELMHEQPLLAGAIGLAAGAIFAAMLPNTRTENRVFGRTSDRFRDETSAALRDEAGRVVDEGANVVRETADRVGRSAEKAAGEGKAEAKSAANRAADRAESRPDASPKPAGAPAAGASVPPAGATQSSGSGVSPTAAPGGGPSPVRPVR